MPVWQRVAELKEARRVYLAGEGDEMASHLALTKMKLAPLFAILEGRLAVNNEDWDLAIELIVNNHQVIRWVMVELAEEKAKVENASEARYVRRQLQTASALETQAIERVANSLVRKVEREPNVRASMAKNALGRDRGLFEDALALAVADGRLVERGGCLDVS